MSEYPKYLLRLPGCEYGSCDVLLMRSDEPGHREEVWSGTVESLAELVVQVASLKFAMSVERLATEACMSSLADAEHEIKRQQKQMAELRARL